MVYSSVLTPHLVVFFRIIALVRLNRILSLAASISIHISYLPSIRPGKNEKKKRPYQQLPCALRVHYEAVSILHVNVLHS